MKKIIPALLVIKIILFPISALTAEDDENLHPDSGSFGFLAAATYCSGSIGFIYHFSETVALNPSFRFYQENFAVSNYGGSLELDIFFPMNNSFSIYLGINGGYTYDFRRYNTSRYENHYISGALTIGGRYMVSDRFGIFADIGFSYTYSREDSRYFDSTTGLFYSDRYYSHTFQTTCAEIGAVFYLSI